MGNLTNCESLFQHKKVVSYASTRKKQSLTNTYPDELLNRQSELVSECRHKNKFLLKNFNSNN